VSGYRNPRIMAGILVENRGYALQEWMLQSLLSGVQPWRRWLGVLCLRLREAD
jgi:hypothetical protein